eukprot:1194057-Prorocentrum_minimum.AAC.3
MLVLNVNSAQSELREERAAEMFVRFHCGTPAALIPNGEKFPTANSKQKGNKQRDDSGGDDGVGAGRAAGAETGGAGGIEPVTSGPVNPNVPNVDSSSASPQHPTDQSSWCVLDNIIGHISITPLQKIEDSKPGCSQRW